ncbi:type I-E CRISPR-associated endonuclease Cas1e [Streptomyces sp. ST2-7A]|uniref:type I-E CRISPR-associated endonuclease Cas1e n=1 Tax=Streptomyces sp. ST2-7A TaxID=2907214 RepID=UPI001F2FB78C|nr:type I-E CRISPR-associated endonuclease Cas1e [Streptomyces sp. ST2-7A]MCE7081876.1 type I-E CRISPR-associated endonuclease Cas1e [Streptomyces sp. ST2-7A]
MTVTPTGEPGAAPVGRPRARPGRGVASRRVSSPRELTRVGDRVSFVYLEHCVIHREANALTADDGEGTTHIPSATIGTLLLGPGTRVTHQAMSLLGECGAGVVWVGERGVRYYSGGRALTRSASLVQAQATAWANPRSRLDVARAMYRKRFPDEDPAGHTRRELLGMEGRRVRECYAAQAKRVGITWKGRHYVPGDFTAGDPPNQAVTAAGQVMYGVAQSVIAALGCSPGLGFVHSGHELAFALDIADLYKVEIGIPVAFEAAAEAIEAAQETEETEETENANGPEDVGARTRRALRDRIHETRLLERCVEDVKELLLPHGPAGADGTVDGDLGDETAAPDRVTLLGDGEEIDSGYNLAHYDPSDGMIW